MVAFTPYVPNGSSKDKKVNHSPLPPVSAEPLEPLYYRLKGNDRIYSVELDNVPYKENSKRGRLGLEFVLYIKEKYNGEMIYTQRGFDRYEIEHLEENSNEIDFIYNEIFTVFK